VRPPPPAPPVLELRGVVAGYGATTVLRGVSAAVAPCGVLAILGPNGAGKTTMLRVASGVLRPSSGRVLIDGVDVTRRKPGSRVRLGLCHIPDPRGIFPTLTVRENLLLQGPRRRAAERIGLALETFPRLQQRLGQAAGTLSGGEQQMLAVARAYVQAPRVVLLDEVSMGLAPNLVEEIFGYLRRLSEQGVALVIVEQFVHRALAMAGSVLVLARGRVGLSAAAGTVGEEEIFEAYAGVAASNGNGPAPSGGSGADGPEPRGGPHG
jgi:branched-chain amino acid transport system ATP-binding protein